MNKNELVAVVTGAAKGIGTAILKRLYEDRFKVIVALDLSVDAVEKVAREIDSEGNRIVAYRCDVTDEKSVGEVFGNVSNVYGTISVLVNNAGITKDAMFHKMKKEQWDSVFDVNINGVFNTCRAVIPAMRAQAYGKIVNIASVSAFGNVGQTNYGASKAAVIGFTKCLARESAGKNITVNAIAPSYVNTDMLRAVPASTMQRFIDLIPAHRLAEPSEIASVVSFLASDDSSFINGECIVASGGSYM